MKQKEASKGGINGGLVGLDPDPGLVWANDLVADVVVQALV